MHVCHHVLLALSNFRRLCIIFMWAERHACRMKILPRELGIPTLLVLHYEFVHVFDLTVTTRDAKTMQIII